MTLKEAKEKGILQDKVVYLKLIPKPNSLTSDPNSPAYGGFDGSTRGLTIGSDERNKLIDPFSSDDERAFFEGITKQNLSVYTPNNEYWKDWTYDAVKDPAFIKIGKKFDLSDPNQMLTYKVLLTNKKLVCPSMESYKVFPSPFYEFIFVEEGYEETKASVAMDEKKRMFIFYGKIEDSPTKMRNFLNVYYATNLKTNVATENMSKEALQNEISKIMEDDKDGYLKLIDDPNYETKVFILQAIDVGAVTREGFTYKITGETTDFSYSELTEFIKKIKIDKDLLYGKIEAQIRGKK
jgi:hypothetical protein